MPPKVRRASRGKQALGEQLLGDRFASERITGIKRPRGEGDDAGPEDVPRDDTFAVPTKATRKLLLASKRRTAGDEEDDDVPRTAGAHDDDAADDAAGTSHLDSMLSGAGRGDDDEDEEDIGDVELEYDDSESVATTAEQFDDLGNVYEMDDEEARILDKFQPATTMQQRNLADIILEKIRQKEASKHDHEHGEDCESHTGTGAAIDGVDPRVRKVYLAIGGVLKQYTSGKIPKAFKALPHIKNWETLLFLTKPHEWSPHATYAATRIFAAGLNEKMAQRFYSICLFPIIHDAMLKAKVLHPSLYMAIRKALFKPTAFFKGFLLPMCEEGECTLREALVVGSVLQKMHLPLIPAAVTLKRISDLPFGSANSVFLRVLIDKKMALPLQAIDSLVRYFHKFCHSHPSTEALPVLWHQTLLSFAQRYKADLLPEQIELLKQVCTKHFHHAITPEVRRELQAAAKARLAVPPV